MACDPDRSWRRWSTAAAEREVDAALRGLYARIDEAVADRAPRCEASGRCCRFDTHGHRLYVTGLEIAWFLRQAGSPGGEQPAAPGVSLPLLADAPDRDGCPWQVDGLCSAHPARPMGCRVYFCEPGTEAWQNELYERMLVALRRLHDEHGLPYRYLEWRAGLAEAEAAGVGASVG